MADTVSAIVVAAGRSTRMGGIDKLWLPVAGQPLLAHTLAALGAVDEIRRLVVVLSPGGLRMLSGLRDTPPWNRIDRAVEGGAERAGSVYAGLVAMECCDFVLIHDGARPLVTPDLVRAGLSAARAHGAAIPVVPVTDTIKVVDAGGTIVETPDRAVLRAVQTPQVFRYDVLRRAYEQIGAARTRCTDDAMILERLGLPVATFPGDPRNIKVSTPSDLPLVTLYLSNQVSAVSPWREITD